MANEIQQKPKKEQEPFNIRFKSNAGIQLMQDRGRYSGFYKTENSTIEIG